MRKIRVGVVGLGLIGKAHLDALRRLPEVEVTAVCDRDAAALRSIADRYAVPLGTGDPAELIPCVDAVHNCTPNRLHDPVNRLTIAAGKHVYCEKPLSDTAADALAVWREAERAGVLHGLNHQYRMYPALQEMRARVQSGDAGRIFFAHGRYHQQSGLYAADYGWRMTEGGMSCGLSDIGTHWADAARCVLGQEIVRVMAAVRTIHPVRTKPDGTEIAVSTDDLSCVLMEFSGGAQGMLSVSKVSAGHQNDLALAVDAQHFSMRWRQEDPNRLCFGYKNRPDAELRIAPALVSPDVRDLATLPGGHPLGFNDAIFLALRDFYAAARGEIAASAMRCATFADGFAGMAFVEAALESSRTGRWAETARG